MLRTFLVISVVLILAVSGRSQVDEICGESGMLPSLNSPFANIPYVYGRVLLKGLDATAKFPKITVTLTDAQQTGKRLTVEKSGNYCFRKTSAGGGTLVVEVEGIEMARRSLPAFGPAQQREDFEIHPAGPQRGTPPGVISAKFSHPPNEKTVELYKRAADADKNKDPKQLADALKKIVAIDPTDFIAWAKLGTVYFEQNSLADAEAAFRKSIESKLEYTPAWINVGKIRVAQKQFDSAIEIFKHAASLDPTSARTYQLLGEVYLQARKGTLGVEALNEAIRLDPLGMAESHLLIGRLYELAGANQHATREYKLLLTKVPDHPDKKKLERYIKENPEDKNKN